MTDPLTPQERAELKELTALKAWKAPRYYELTRKATTAANDAWRKADVLGHTFEVNQ